jgi:hypothetical protein
LNTLSTFLKGTNFLQLLFCSDTFSKHIFVIATKEKLDTQRDTFSLTKFFPEKCFSFLNNQMVKSYAKYWGFT